MRSLAIVQLALAWLIFAALYLLLAGQISATEIEAGGPLTILIVTFMLLQRRIARQRMSVPMVLKAYIRPIATLLPDAFRVGKVILSSLVRRPGAKAGHLLHQPFNPGDRSPPEAGRRAVVELGASLAPNAFVVRLNPEDNTLLLHCLHPKSENRDRTWPA
jgi:hypothetical protein